MKFQLLAIWWLLAVLSFVMIFKGSDKVFFSQGTDFFLNVMFCLFFIFRAIESWRMGIPFRS